MILPHKEKVMPFLILVPFLLLLIVALAILLMSVPAAYFSLKGIIKLLTWLFSSSSSLPPAITKALKESRYYGRLIIRTVQEYPAGPLQQRLNQTITPVTAWLNNLDELEAALSKLYNQRHLTRELRQLNHEIEALQHKASTTSEREADCMADLIASKQKHQTALEELQSFQNQAELKICKIASDLGTTHTEILLMIAKGDFNEKRFRRLDENLQEHMASMRDVMSVMEEMGYGIPQTQTSQA
jgi:hypothetical protein